MVKTIKRRKSRNKTCKITHIPATDKDIKAIIDVNAIRNNIRYLRKKSGTDLMPVLHLFSFKMLILYNIF
jgi:alanine racemase